MIFFTSGMIILPILSFFISQYFFGAQNTILNGGIAAFIANVVLISFVIAAFTEDTTVIEEKESKKDK